MSSNAPVVAEEYHDNSSTDDMMDTKPSVPQFPQELNDLIIDYLHDDAAALQACSLTCHAWLSRSRSHLHRTLKLSSSARCQAVHEIYKDTILPIYIREVHVVDHSYRTDENSRLCIIQEIPKVFSKLQGLTVDNVLFQDVHIKGPVRWGEPLFRTVTKLTLTRFEFGTANQYVTFIGHFPNLKVLLLDSVSIAARGGDPSLPGLRPRLHTLKITAASGQAFLLNWFLNQKPEEVCLKTLAYSVERWAVNAPSAALQAFGESVNDLTVVFAYESPHYLLKGDPLLSYFTSLHSLSFDHATLYGTLYGPSSIPVLLRLVASMDITSLGLRFALDGSSGTPDDNLEKVARIRLSETDRLLGSLANFSKLSRVAVDIRSNQWSKLLKLPTVSEWVRVELEQKRLNFEKDRLAWKKWKAASHSVAADAMEGEGSDLDKSKIDSEWERTVMQRARVDFERTEETWWKAQHMFKEALPEVARQKILKIEPVEYERSESPPRSARSANPNAHRNLHYVFPINHHDP